MLQQQADRRVLHLPPLLRPALFATPGPAANPCNKPSLPLQVGEELTALVDLAHAGQRVEGRVGIEQQRVHSPRLRLRVGRGGVGRRMGKGLARRAARPQTSQQWPLAGSTPSQASIPNPRHQRQSRILQDHRSGSSGSSIDPAPSTTLHSQRPHLRQNRVLQGTCSPNTPPQPPKAAPTCASTGFSRIIDTLLRRIMRRRAEPLPTRGPPPSSSSCRDRGGSSGGHAGETQPER